MKKLILFLILLPLVGVSQNQEVNVNIYDGGIDTTQAITVNVFCKSKIFINHTLKEIENGKGFIVSKSGSVQSKAQNESQDFFTEWKKYLADCNELVNDTVIQKGTVNCELVPVKMNGKIVSYSQVPKDTVWQKCECRDYSKYFYDGINIYSSNLSRNYPSIGAISLTGDYNNIYTFSEPDQAKNTFSITRKKICRIKKVQARFDDFISRWCVDKKLIEFN